MRTFGRLIGLAIKIALISALTIFLGVSLLFIVILVTNELDTRSNVHKTVDGTEITLTIRPMLFTVHSEWERWLRIRKNGTTRRVELIDDTGWWRGSYLYRDTADRLIMHEGQIGCFWVDAILPLENLPRRSCVPLDVPSPLNLETCQSGTPPISWQFPGWTFLGIFPENSKFRSYEEICEGKLRAPL